MFSGQQWRTMPSHTSPEMLRSPLERVALLIKGMAGHDLLAGVAGAGGVARVLSRCLSPPAPAAIAGATRLLQQIGAFDGEEELTALGGHLNRMPMDPRVGGCIAGNQAGSWL
jgi:HrpA-like RNA helicase